MYKSLGDKIKDVLEVKHGHMNTTAIHVTKQRSCIADATVRIETLWVGNDYTSSGYLRAQRAKPSFQEAVVRRKRFMHDTGKMVDGTLLSVTHVIKGRD